MNEREFWLAIWKTIAVAVCLVVTTSAGCSIHQTKRLAESDDPVALACALSSDRSQACVAYLGAKR